MIKFLLTLFLTAQFIFPQSSNFDFSGITQFWHIVSILKSNQLPSSSDWDNLFNTPGYKVLTSGEFSRQFFINEFTLVFMPSKKEELQKALASRRDLAHLNHFIKVRDNKQLMDEQLRKLKSHNYSADAVKRTLEFLPQSSVSEYPPVSFVIFENNGRGSSPIVVDLAASINWDFMSFLSHEFHHWYRNRELQYAVSKVSWQDAYLVDALSKIEAEGIADMVDKRDWFTKPSNAVSDYARQYIYDVKRTPSVINRIDKLLSQLSSKPNSAHQIGMKISQTLPEKGHSTGYFMASLILQNIGKDELVSCVGNPFKFIKLYNQAAKQSSGQYPAFSDSAIKVIDLLISKYVF